MGRRRILRALSILGGIALGVWLSLPAEVKAGKGDTWTSIAARYGVAVRALRAANPGMASPKPGEAVRLPIPRWRFHLRAWGVERAVAEIMATPTPARTARKAAAPAPTAPAVPIERRDIAEAAFARINAERQAVGAPPLAWDEGLYQASIARAWDMFERKYFSHYDPQTGALLVPCPCEEVISASFDPAANWKTSAPHWNALMNPGHSRGAMAVLQVPPFHVVRDGRTIPILWIAVGLVR